MVNISDVYSVQHCLLVEGQYISDRVTDIYTVLNISDRVTDICTVLNIRDSVTDIYTVL